MSKSCTNIYRKARNQAGLTREDAAYQLHIGERTLAAYESGESIPNGNLVNDMIELCKTKWLAYTHLNTNEPDTRGNARSYTGYVANACFEAAKRNGRRIKNQR